MLSSQKMMSAPSGGGSDDNFKNVTLLLNGDGTNGAQNNTFVDSSSNNFTITRNGNTTQGSFSPYGSLWSNYFNGSNNDYLYTSSNVTALGTGDFTIECWANFGYEGAQSLFGYGDSTSGGFFVRKENTRLNFYSSGDNLFSITVSLGTWYHIAFTRQSGDLKCWVNGSQIGSAIGLATNFSASVFYIGAGKVGASVPYNPLTGNISNLRMVVGTAVYSSSFTPSTTPLTAVSGTSLLTCQSNRFIDNSSNAYTISIGGTPSVQRFSPFNPTASYDTATIGGSGYFGGDTNYLSSTLTGQSIGSGDFTIECWLYPTAFNGDPGLFQLGPSTSPSNDGVGIFCKTSTGVVSLVYDGTYVNGSIAAKLNAWNHIAVVRSGSSLKLYVNGVQAASVSSSTNFTYTTLLVGAYYDAATYGMEGYISNFRYVKGTAVYTTTFTPPTAPVTAISGTQFLSNFTNAGIPDSAMMNDLETVGNAQVSTSVKKFGTGSLAFDGTGDYLTAPLSNNFAFGTGDFTIECWIYLPTTPSGGYAAILDTREAGGSASNAILFCVNSSLGITVDPGISTSGNFSTNTWHHVALCQASGVMQAFVDGSSVASYTNTNNRTKTGCYIGRVVDNAHPAFNGYIDDLRITKGYARYTSTFTPPTAALPVK